ncbi:hypothetical protein SEVIR_2G172401v4 [Setaria viridis]
MAMINNIGESGSPCRSPLALCMSLPGSPFRRTRVVAEQSRDEIQSRHLVPNPIAARTCNMNGQLTVSNALEMSSLKSRVAFFLRCNVLAACSMNLKLSWMDRLWMKALWLVLMRRCSSGARRFARSLATSLPKL